MPARIGVRGIVFQTQHPAAHRTTRGARLGFPITCRTVASVASFPKHTLIHDALLSRTERAGNDKIKH